MSPELKVFLVVGAIMALAYTNLYPRLRSKTLMWLMWLYRALSAVILVLAGAVYYGTEIRFSLIIFTVPWWAFTLLSAALVEAPLFIWFCKRWDIDLSPPTD
ncbi:hypothetical protein [Sulfitobacter sp.]|uniref:hypothetical protein n=1 Tax=Sulfitobacter sp. TaxID=1903071 RepID=UPI003001E75D